VHPAARRHSIRDAHIRHAVAHCLYEGQLDEDGPPWRVLYLGPDRAGNLLEIIVLERDDADELAIHAMNMRLKYEELLPWETTNG